MHPPQARWTLPCAVVLVGVLMTPQVALGSTPAHAEISAPTPVQILRPTPNYPRIFVQVTLPDGELGLFLVDTGADISVLSQSTADRLGLHIDEGYSSLSGLSGTVPMDRAILPEIRFGEDGETTVRNIEVAVGVRGMSDTVQFMPLDGLLGNNVWSQFGLEINYPNNQMVLHPPGTLKNTQKPVDETLWSTGKGVHGVSPMIFDGSHIYAPLTLTTNADPPTTHTLIAQVDTGAGQLTLCAASGQPFAADVTEGLETIRGIGASETMPPHRFLEMTRRIPLSEVSLGGDRFAMDGSARWVDFRVTDRDTCGTGMRALLGHEYLQAHQVWFDYARGRMKMRKVKAKSPRENGHQVLYEQDLARHGAERPERALYRAKLLVGADRADEAMALLEHLPDSLSEEDHAEARVLLVRLYRHKGYLDKAWAVLSPIAPGDLVEQGEIIGSVNGLLFEGRAEEALALANAAVIASPDRGDAWVARADASLYAGDAVSAAKDLQRAATLEGYPDAHLLRRARVAQAQGDRHGAIAHIRKLLQLYPFAGEFLWFYALLLDGPGDATTFRYDMIAAMNRLHPDMQPIDFQVAANHVLGEQQLAVEMMDEGIAATCDLARENTHERDNCLAWFWSLAGVKPDEALRRIDSALATAGERSDYLDTKAIVHLSRGELDLASTAAYKAARLSPDDVYMLWQAERITALRDHQESP